MIPTSLLREYKRLRKLGFIPRQASDGAKAKTEFGRLEMQDKVRLRVEPDNDADMGNLKGDCFDPRVNPDIPQAKLEQAEREFEERIERDGVVGIIAEYWDERNEEWEHADSCFGFIGDDWIDSGYDFDLMQSAVDAYYGQAKEEPPTLQQFLSELTDEFPGLLDGETNVNGADLVDWLTEQVQRYHDE